jgi:hypothetical protein
MLMRRMGLAAMVMGLGMAVGACEENKPRPDMDANMAGGLTAKDLRTMTDRMAPSLLALRQIAGNPNRVTIVVKGVKNGLEGENTKDLDIYVARLAGLLNESGQDRVAFIEENRTLRPMQAEELGPNNPAVASGVPDPKIIPQFFLYGDFKSMRGPKSTYYLCQFKLTNANSGEIVWSRQYDTSTWNH